MDKLVLIEHNKLKKYIQGYLKYTALKEGGVDNWIFYDDSLDNYLNTFEYIEDFDEAYNELAEEEIEHLQDGSTI